MRRTLFCVVAAMSLTGGAMASDLPTHKAPPPPAPSIVPAFSWTGFYGGLQGGYSWDGEEVYAAGISYSLERSGGFGGVVAGYDYQIGNFVIGAQGEYNIASIQGSATPAPTYSLSTRVNSFGSLDARAGFAIDRILVYGLGGVAFGSIDHTITLTGIEQDSFSAFQTGYDYGAGAEYAFTNNWAMFAEYRHYNFGHENFAAVGALGPHHTVETLSSMLLGVVYKFGD